MEKRAYRMAMASAMMKEMVFDLCSDFGIFDNPFKFSRDDCYQVYWKLETVRNTSRISMQQRSALLPAFLKEHMLACEEALEIWMVTVGVGIRPEGRDNARLCWDCIRASHSSLPAAIDAIYEINLKMGESVISKGMTKEKWAEEAAFVPSCFTSKLE